MTKNRQPQKAPRPLHLRIGKQLRCPVCRIKCRDKLEYENHWYWQHIYKWVIPHVNDRNFKIRDAYGTMTIPESAINQMSDHLPGYSHDGYNQVDDPYDGYDPP